MNKENQQQKEIKKEYIKNTIKIYEKLLNDIDKDITILHKKINNTNLTNQEKKEINKWIEEKRIYNNELIEQIKNLQNKKNKNICLYFNCYNEIKNMFWCNTHFKKIKNKNKNVGVKNYE